MPTSILRFIYTVLLCMALPFLFLRLCWRSRKNSAYRQRLTERLGFYPKQVTLNVRDAQCIWIHAVSVGEVIAAIPLIKKLKKDYPDYQILVTTMTITGAERVKSMFGTTVQQVYLPYDLPKAMNRFFNLFHPVIAIIMETELWPNLINTCYRRRTPLYLLNARLSEKSANGYQRIASITYAMLQQFTMIAANSEADAKRFIALGAKKENVVVTGNIKFDLEIPENLNDRAQALRNVLGRDRFIWVAASTHEGEEEIILAAHKKIRLCHSKALLILVPRHPERFNSVASLSMKDFSTQRRSAQEPIDPNTAVYLGDTMGEMMLMYAACDVAFVGGSLIPRGGHNILEPGSLGKPVVTGNHLFNFAEISHSFMTKQALIKVTDTDSLSKAVIELMNNGEMRQQYGQRALDVILENKGALDKQLRILPKLA